MNIDKHNIEELIFDYHEGNLTTAQKNKLLDYIHQHPDYEALFAQWALTYGHVMPKSKDYGLTDRLLKPQRAVWYKSFWFYGSVATGIMALLWWYGTPTSREHQASPHRVTMPTDRQDIRTGKEVEQSSHLDQPQKVNLKRLDTPKAIVGTPGILQESTEVPLTILPIRAEAEERLGTADTVAMYPTRALMEDTSIQEQRTSKTQKGSARKKKRPLLWEPTEDYVPTNSDF